MKNPLSQLLATVGGCSDTDAALLARFRDRHDQTAFAELVRRHGPLVFGVCRRALGQGPDAEDAFQACFLVLARRLDTACEVGNLAGWLYRVACLTAKKVRIHRAKRREKEKQGVELPDVPAPPDRDPELGYVIDEALAKLPERYRTAVVLCELRELTVDEAAAELGVPRGTVASRLSRGRALLGHRLLRRGLAGVGLTGGLATARVPAGLVYQAAEAALGTADGIAVQLSQEVLKAMNGFPMKTLAVAGLAVLAVAVGGLSWRGAETHAAPVPELKAKVLTAELDRVRVDKIAAALACPTIRKELKITAEQDKKLDEAWDEASVTIRTAMQRQQIVAQNTPESVLDIFNGLDDTVIGYDLKAVKVLTAEQLTRLRQIQLQRDGAAALLSRHAGRVLKLSPDQEDKIAAEVAKTRGTAALMLMIELQAGNNDPQIGAMVEAIRQKQADDFDTLRKAAFQHLTGEQKKAWSELTGSAIPSVDLIRASTAFGDPRFAKLIHGEQQAQPVAPPPAAAPPVPVEQKK